MVPVACTYAWPAPGGRVTPGWRWPAVVGRWNRPGSRDDERCHAGVVRGISSFSVAYCDIFKFFSSFLVPAADKCSPPMSRKSSMISPPLVKKLSVWSIKTQSFSSARLFSASFTASARVIGPWAYTTNDYTPIDRFLLCCVHDARHIFNNFVIGEFCGRIICAHVD